MQFTPSLYRGFMLKHFKLARRLRKTIADNPEEYFGFHPEDIEVIHFHFQGVGEGTWFRLNDGRVFNRFAELCDSDPSFYDATTH